MIDLHQFSPETLVVASAAIGLFIGGFIGALGIGLFHVRNGRRCYRAGCRDTDRLWTARIAQDRRDDAPLSQPITR